MRTVRKATPFEANHAQFAFSVLSDDKTYVFATKEEANRDRWIDVLKEVARSAHDQARRTYVWAKECSQPAEFPVSVESRWTSLSSADHGRFPVQAKAKRTGG